MRYLSESVPLWSGITIHCAKDNNRALRIVNQELDCESLERPSEGGPQAQGMEERQLAWRREPFFLNLFHKNGGQPLVFSGKIPLI